MIKSAWTKDQIDAVDWVQSANLRFPVAWTERQGYLVLLERYGNGLFNVSPVDGRSIEKVVRNQIKGVK